MLPVLIVLSLAGCDSPGPEFGALPGTRVVVEGSHFAVRRKDGTAQAIRLNAGHRPGTMARGARAIELGTGCRIRPGTLSGDPAVIYARLSCAAP
ncbi:hypothetical protein [Rhodovulum strictum]|uniref:Uncharacterized protein n=1 Tax=Rhodovulum strictum TaxID=58314 RepID=A0A844BL16_9RHOB|nr:hypothetical protein [Rhodovulum strictum]MRH21702.1 hypothetical protein [Rhodovulum strictum]